MACRSVLGLPGETLLVVNTWRSHAPTTTFSLFERNVNVLFKITYYWKFAAELAMSKRKGPPAGSPDSDMLMGKKLKLFLPSPAKTYPCTQALLSQESGNEASQDSDDTCTHTQCTHAHTPTHTQCTHAHTPTHTHHSHMHARAGQP